MSEIAWVELAVGLMGPIGLASSWYLNRLSKRRHAEEERAARLRHVDLTELIQKVVEPHGLTLELHRTRLDGHDVALASLGYETTNPGRG